MRFKDLSTEEQSYVIFDELKERIIWCNFLKEYTNIIYNDSSPVTSFLQWDVNFHSGSTAQLYTADIKVRTCTSFDYTSTILEVSKYTGLTQSASEQSAIPYLIVLFADNKIALFNLKTCYIKIGNITRPDGKAYNKSLNQNPTSQPHYLLRMSQAEIHDIPPAPDKYNHDYNEWALNESKKRFPDRSFSHIEWNL